MPVEKNTELVANVLRPFGLCAKKVLGFDQKVAAKNLFSRQTFPWCLT